MTYSNCPESRGSFKDIETGPEFPRKQGSRLGVVARDLQGASANVKTATVDYTPKEQWPLSRSNECEGVQLVSVSLCLKRVTV